MKRMQWVVAAVVLGCSSGRVEPETPAAPTDDGLATSPSESEAGEIEEAESDPSSDEEPKGDDSVELTREETVSVLQHVLDDQEVTGYLRLEEPGRMPLKISGDVVPGGAKLTKGMETVFVDEPKADEPVLVFETIEARGDRIKVRIRLDADGTKGWVTLERGDSGFSVVKSRISQRELTPAE